MLKRIPLFLLVFLIGQVISAQDFDFKQVDNPPDLIFNQYIGETGDLAYLSFFDDYYYNSFLYSFDGDQMTEVPAPADLTYSFSAGQGGDAYYLVFNDYSYNNTIVQLDDAGLTELFAIDPSEFFSNFEFERGGIPYFSIFDNLFNETLRYFDGTDLLPVVLPDNLFFSNTLGEFNGLIYMTLEDGLNNETIYSFDGSSFSPVTMPFVSPLVQYYTQTTDGMYLGIFDDGFTPMLFFFDGTSMTSVDTPMGVTGAGGFVGSINERLFFSFEDASFDEAIYELEVGGTWKEITNPTGLTYFFSTGPLESEDLLFPLYSDDYFIYNMTVFDGDNLKVVGNPPGREYSTYYVPYKQGHMVSFRDDYFNNFLYFFNNGTDELLSVAPPTDFSFNSYSFQYGNNLYFEFVDNSFNSTLFSLKLNTAPLSADNSVSTERESPYTFEVTDFSFSDEDEDDTIKAIEIVSLPSKGILHVFGAQVGEGQLILTEDLDKLNYLPLDNGVGEPYDNFTFKVSDGFSLSESLYTMFINVNPTVGLEENALAASLDIFPNPSTDFVTVRLQDYDLSKQMRITLIGANGQVIQNQIMDDQQETLDLTNLPGGIYQLLLNNETTQLTRGLIINR